MVVASKNDRAFKPPTFHDTELRRGWRVLRQSLDLTVDLLNHAVRGRATITFAVVSTQCTAFNLNLRRSQIEAISMNGRSVGFDYHDPLDDTSFLHAVSSENSRIRVDQVLEKSESLGARSDIAELCVHVPPDVSADLIDALSALTAGDPAAEAVAEAAAEAAAGSSSAVIPPPQCQVSDLPTLSLDIKYRAMDSTAGATFHANPSYMLVDGRFGMARCWMPCVDSLIWCDRCLWDIKITVERDLVVIASGDLIEKKLVPVDDCGANDTTGSLHGLTLEHVATGQALAASTARASAAQLQSSTMKQQFSFHVNTAVHPSDIGVVVGEFLALPDPSTPSSVTHFCTPGRSRDLVHTAPDVFSLSREFCSEYFGMDLPCSSFKQVFIGSSDSHNLPHSCGGGLVVLGEDILHNEKCIDEGFDARMAIASATVSTYLGGLIRPRTSEDAWFVAGLAYHVTALSLISILGKNWYRLYIYHQIREMSKDSKSDAPVLAEVGKDPSFSMDKAKEAVRRRALVIAYIIERRIGADVLRRAMRDVVAETRRALLGNYLYDDSLLGLSVGPFLKRLRAISGTDVRNLVRVWAASCGTPRIRLAYKYNPRRHQIEFAIEQRGLNDELLSDEREGLHFQGSLCVRVMEPEGSFDHTIDVIDSYFLAELPCHSRRTKQKPVSLPEKDGGDNAARILPVSWARIDPDMEWCIDYMFTQPESAWAALLQSERDVVAQMDACRGLAEFGTTTAALALSEALSNKELYWRVRAEAATALSVCNGGLESLLTHFCDSYTDLDKPQCGTDVRHAVRTGKITSVRANDFTDISDYMLKRSVIKAIASIRNRRQDGDEVPNAVAEFIISVLMENDNSGNSFNEDYYLADVLTCASKIAVSCISDKRSTANRIVTQIKRYRLLDRLVPSRSGVVAAAIMHALAEIEIGKICDDDSRDDASRTRRHRTTREHFQPDPDVLTLLSELSPPAIPFPARIASLLSFARLYGGDLESILWLLARVDRSSNGDDVLELPLRGELLPPGHFIEAGGIRRAVIKAICDTAKQEESRTSIFDLTHCLRTHTRKAILICRRILRLSVGDADATVRESALQIAKSTWGRGIPACLLRDDEYQKVSSGVKSVQMPFKSGFSGTGTNSKISCGAEAVSKPEFSHNGSKSSVVTGLTSKPIKLKSSTPNLGTAKGKRSNFLNGSKIGKEGITSSQRRDDGKPVEHEVLERKPIGVPFTKPLGILPVRHTSVLVMTDEDRRYLLRAWKEKKEKQGNNAARSNDTKCTYDESYPAKARDVHITSSDGRHPLEVDKGNEPYEKIDNDESLQKGEKRKKKRRRKKRKREGDSDGVSAEQSESGEHHKKKKKKKKRREKEILGDADEDSYAQGGALSISGPMASSDGSFRSGDGKLAILKIKIGSSGAQLSTSAS